MRLRLELDVPEHVPPPARFVFCRLYDAAQQPPRLLGNLSLDEDTARELARLVNGEPVPERAWRSPYDDDGLDAIEPGQTDAGTEDAHWPDGWRGEQCPNCNQPLSSRGCGACGWPRPWEELGS